MMDGPPEDTIRECVAAFTHAPGGYTLDMGWITGLWFDEQDAVGALVEVNPGYAFGSYGADPEAYLRTLWAWWQWAWSRPDADGDAP